MSRTRENGMIDILFLSFFFFFLVKSTYREESSRTEEIASSSGISRRGNFTPLRLYLEEKRVIKYRSKSDVVGPWSMINRVDMSRTKYRNIELGTRNVLLSFGNSMSSLETMSKFTSSAAKIQRIKGSTCQVHRPINRWIMRFFLGTLDTTKVSKLSQKELRLLSLYFLSARVFSNDSKTVWTQTSRIRVVQIILKVSANLLNRLLGEKNVI